MTVALITGADTGFGYETARQLIERGHAVWAGSRDVAHGEEAAPALGGRFVQFVQYAKALPQVRFDACCPSDRGRFP